MEILNPQQMYESEKPFNADAWVALKNYRNLPGLWRTTKGYIRIVDMEFSHLSTTISFVERRDPNYKKSKVWAELVAEYHKRDKPVKVPASAPKQELAEKPKRKFRFGGL